MRRTLLLALAAAATLAFAAPASAGEFRSRTVSYADLDLSNPHDAQTMLTRIRQGARDVCRYSGHDSLDRMVMERDCRRETVAHTVATLDSPMVTAAFEGRTPTLQIASLH
ncbi:MAG: UrcA family protein [Pseudomonadota bacterium]